MIDVIIYHNPDCGTSRNTLGLIRNSGIEPHVIEYLKCPPSRALLKSLVARMGVSVRDVVRVKGTPLSRPWTGRSNRYRRSAARCNDCSSDPYQSANRGDATRREAMSTFGNRA